MLTHWNKLFNTDCIVVDVGPYTIYPIFRVGQSTLISVSDKKYINKEIEHCNHIDIMIREPESRFVSGVNEYCRQNNLDIKSTWKLINDGKVHDRHFTPQYIWLLHLYKWYKGFVTIRPFSYISNITEVHKHPSGIITQVPICESFVAVDRHLTKYYNETVNIGYLIKRYRYALS